MSAALHTSSTRSAIRPGSKHTFRSTDMSPNEHPESRGSSCQRHCLIAGLVPCIATARGLSGDHLFFLFSFFPSQRVIHVCIPLTRQFVILEGQLLLLF